MISTASTVATVRAIPADRDAGSHRAIAAWLLACCALVFAMVVVGGVTRLTHSGLSIVEWQPIVGALPPLDDAQWQQAFELYKQTPEYKLVNAGMNSIEVVATGCEPQDIADLLGVDLEAATTIQNAARREYEKNMASTQ